MRVLREDTGQDFALTAPPLARGGEAAVYAVPEGPSLVAKVYHRPTPEAAAKLAAMIAAPPVDTTAWTASRYVAWPVARLLRATNGNDVVGYLMPRVENARRLVELASPRARQQICPLFHYGYLVRTARNLAAAIGGLHGQGFVLGDLNESNVLVTPSARVTLVDADSFQVPAPGRTFRCRVGKLEYTPPELQDACLAERDLGPEHDAFALGVLIFQLLMQGLHPFAGVSAADADTDTLPARIQAGHWPYAWERAGPVGPVPQAPPWAVLPPSVQELLTCCFEEGHLSPARRPGAAAWQQALAEAENGLMTCQINAQHRFPRGLDTCPWCELARDQGRDPFPSPEHLQARRAAKLTLRTAPGSSDGVGLPPRPPAAPLPELDPNDPLPPRATEGAPEPGATSRSPDPVAAPVPPAGGQSSRAVWVAAAAIGAILGIVGTLWKYQPPPAKSHPIAAEVTHTPQPLPAPPSVPAVVPPVRPIVPQPMATEENDRAVQKAAADLRDAQSAYQQALRQHERALKEYAQNRPAKEDLVLFLAQLGEKTREVFQRQQAVMEKQRLLNELRQAPTRDKP
jgi:hypothetical protein